MTWATGIMVYVVIWWTVIFAVLPLGVRRAQDPVPGTERGAPERPELLRKILVTSAVAAVVWLLWYVVWGLDVFSFRQSLQS
jgi:predicted secreted protein